MIHSGAALEGLTMGNATSDWADEFERWLKRFLHRLVIRPGSGCVGFRLRD